MLKEPFVRSKKDSWHSWGQQTQSHSGCINPGKIERVIVAGTQVGLTDYEVYLYKQNHPSGSSGLTSFIEDVLRRIRLLQVKVPNPTDVREYLLDRIDGMSAVYAACNLAANKFSNRAQLSLELYRDPEIDWKQLTLYIRMEKYPVDVVDEIDEVRERCELTVGDYSSLLFLTTDFQSPR